LGNVSRFANVSVFDCAAPVRTSPYHLNRKRLAADDLFSLPGNDKLLNTIIAFFIALVNIVAVVWENVKYQFPDCQARLFS
jgi:hypothetical protein